MTLDQHNARRPADRNAAYLQTKRTITRQKCRHKTQRLRLEADTAAWLKHYLAEAYPLPWGQVHLDIIRGAEDAVSTGGCFGVVAPRGTGKSVVLWGVALKLMLTGRVRFPAVLPWAAKDQRKALRFWKNALCYSARLAADYPEYCQPFAACRGSSQKCLSLVWADTGRPTGAELRVFDGMIVLPDGKGAIGSATVNGNPRGLNHATEDGEVLRPDLVLIDDPQDKEVAKSPAQVSATVDVIDTDVAGMAGPDRRMPMLMACTVIRPNDVACHYLRAPTWRFVRVAQVTQWPADMDAWKPFAKMMADGDEKAAVAHYQANRTALTAGMAVSWEARFDKSRGEPDAYYSAMRDYYTMGDAAFFSERQNDPREENTGVYRLESGAVASHQAPMDRLCLPPQTTTIIAATDINRYGLYWAVGAFAQDMTLHIPAYGNWPPDGSDVWPENAPELEIAQRLFAGLTKLWEHILLLPFRGVARAVRPSLFFVDRGYKPDVVHRFCQQAPGRVACRGYAAHKYSVHKATLIGSPHERAHTVQGREGPFVAFDADYWREVTQRAWLGEPGQPGGATLFRADPRQHNTFAEHLTAQKLRQKYKTDAGMRWEWTNQPGGRWDLCDAVEMLYVGAACCGLRTQGQPVVAGRRYVERRKCKVEAEL